VIIALQECLILSEKEKSSVVFRKQIEALLEFVQMGDFLLGKVSQQERNKIMPLLVKLIGAK
jgi:hypothetical protein